MVKVGECMSKSSKSVNVKGIDELLKKLNDMEVTGQELSGIIDKCEKTIVGELKDNAPVDTGSGRDTIQKTRDTEGRYDGFAAEKFGSWVKIKAFSEWRGIWFQNFLTDSKHFGWFNRAWKNVSRKVSKQIKNDLMELYRNKIKK